MEIASASRQATAVREFIGLFEMRIREMGVDPVFQSAAEAWLAWARAKVKRTDPLSRPPKEVIDENVSAANESQPWQLTR